MTIQDSNASYRRGFQLTATGGTFTAGAGTTLVNGSGGRQYITQSGSANSYSFDWTPPAGGDRVTVYVAGVATRGTSQTNVYTSTATLTAATAARPAISDAGVLNGASFGRAIAAGSWVTIFGSNLAAPGVARAWSGADIVDGRFPTSLDGTSVTINGKAAYIAYVSETQLNVQAPADTALGDVPVVVTTAAGVSTAAMAQLAQAGPGLFRFAPQGNRYAAAVTTGGELVGPAGLFGAGSARAARPGETILLFGTGFGPTDPVVAPGAVFSGAAALASGHNLTVRIGGVNAAVQFAGLSGAGLYQFNVTVPDSLPDGDHAVEMTAWGVAVPTAQMIAVQRQ